MTICWFYIELSYNWILIDSLFKWISVTFSELSTFWFWNQLEHCVIFSCRKAVLLKEISKASSIAFLLWHTTHYYINTNEIPGELSHENMISSHVKITCYFHMWKNHCCYGYIINRAFRRIKLFQWNGWVFHWCLYN